MEGKRQVEGIGGSLECDGLFGVCSRVANDKRGSDASCPEFSLGIGGVNVQLSETTKKFKSRLQDTKCVVLGPVYGSCVHEP